MNIDFWNFCIANNSYDGLKSLKHMYSASRAISEIIEKMSDLRFTINYFGNSSNSKVMVNQIIRLTESPLEVRFFESARDMGRIDMEKSQIFIHETVFIHKIEHKVKLLQFRKKFILFYFMRIKNFEKFSNAGIWPHDQYFLVHTPMNYSLVLLNNKLFFNGTCDSHFHAINKFNEKNFSWENVNFLSKNEQFFNCEIEVENEDTPTLTYTEEEQKEALKRQDFTKNVLKEFAQKHQIVLSKNSSIFMQMFMLMKDSEGNFDAFRESFL